MIQDKKEILKDFILGLLNKAGEVPKVKLAKLILLSEIDYFKRTGKSITDLYFVRLKRGPVIAFFDEVLENGEGKYWEKKSIPINIVEEGREKVQYSYKPKQTSSLAPPIKQVINKVWREYGHKTGTQLALLTHNLPAWKYSEPNEPIYLVELAVKDEKEYFALTDLVEDIDEEDNDLLAKKLSQALPKS